MRYERLIVWQKSMDLCTTIYALTKQLKDYGFKDQICRASVSVPSNIAEGSERMHRKEQIYFYSIAKGSIAEVKTQLIIGERIGYFKTTDIKSLKGVTEEISKMLNKLSA